MMWYRRYYPIIYIYLMFVTIIKGSCLEYGHSCWGAHGKRSGVKSFQPIEQTSTNDLNSITDNNEKPILDNFEDFSFNVAAASSLENPSATQQQQQQQQQRNAPNTKQTNARIRNDENANKLHNFLKQQHRKQHNLKFYNKNPNNNNNKKPSTNEARHMIEEESINTRWPKLTLFNLKSFGQADDELTQQQAGSPQAAALDELIYYDFQ